MTAAPTLDVPPVVGTVPTGLFVGGAWRASETGRTLDVVDPRTGAPIAAVADATPTDAAAALDAAAGAQGTWGRTAPRRRAALLHEATRLLTERADDVAAVIRAETGKPLAEARGEVAYGTGFLAWFAEQAAHPRGAYGDSPAGDARLITTRVPVGPSLLVTPWNFPLAMATRKLGAALAAGCTTVLKPAEQTPLTAALLVEVLREAGVPPGVVNLVPTSDAAAQSAFLMRDPRLRKVSFTGSTAVGSRLLAQAADHVVATSMELGGNGPFLVLADADVDAAVAGAVVAKFRNAGQSCVAANRILVHRDVAARFTAAFTAQVAALRAGTGDGEPDVGPLIDARARERVGAIVDDAVARGARVRCGGRPVEGPGFSYAPTVLTDVPGDAAVVRQEVFGPVAPITVVDSDAEAVTLANDTAHGLAAFVYSRDVGRVFDVAERLEAGMVGINRGMVSEVAAPFGGVKASGLGREGGPDGIEEYLETKYYALDATSCDARDGGGRA